VCDLHPEFGYVGRPSVRRKLGLVLAFLVFGLVAVGSGLAVVMADFAAGVSLRGTKLRSGIQSFRCSYVERTYLGPKRSAQAEIYERGQSVHLSTRSRPAGDHLSACVE